VSEIILKIDGREARGQTGDTILEVCEKNSIYVPTLCHFQGLTNVGTCRMCSVEVQGARGFNTACTTPAQDGMVVKTESPALTELRRSVLQLLFAERNHYCMFCEMSGDCELQSLAYRYQIDHFKYPFMFPRYEVDSSPKHFALDHNRCILCTRCVRACAEMVVNETLGPTRRGSATLITADLDEAIGGSSCVSCGTCVQICPTGALIDKHSAYGGRSTQTEMTATVCAGCSLGCAVNVVSRSNRVLRVDGNFNSDFNNGILCEQGRYGQLQNLPERHPFPLIRGKGGLVHPLIRWSSGLDKASLDEALDLVHQELRTRARANGGNAIAGVVSPRATNEAIYLFQRLFRSVLGSNNLVTIGESGLPDRSYTVRYWGASLADVEKADHILVIGVDLTRDHQVLGFALKRAVRKGASLTLIAPADNGLSDLATLRLSTSRSDHTPVEGSLAGVAMHNGSSSTPPSVSYGALVHSLMHTIVKSGGAKPKRDNDSSFVAELTRYEATTISKRTGIPEVQIAEAASAYANAKSPVIIAAGDDDGLEVAVLSLAALAGNYDGKKARVLWLGKQVNSRGAKEMGGTSAYLPGRVTWDSPLVQRIGRVWGMTPVVAPNAPRADAVYFLLSDETAPPSETMLRLAKEARFVIVQTAHKSALDEYAHVILPTTTWVERQGSVTSADGVVRRMARAVNPPEGVEEDWAVLLELMGRFSIGPRFKDIDEVAKEITRLVPGYGRQHEPPAGTFTPVCVDFS